MSQSSADVQDHSGYSSKRRLCLYTAVTLAVAFLGNRAEGQTYATPASAGPRVRVTLEAEQLELLSTWISENPHNQRMGQLGELAASKLIRSLGYEQISGGSGRGINQGPDLVFRARDGRVHVAESKFGSSQLKIRYGGLKQGTPEYAVKSSEFALKSNAASAAEKAGARAVIEAAKEGRLVSHVVRTSWKTPAYIEATTAGTEATAKLASSVLADLAAATARNAGKAATAADAAASSTKAAATTAESAASAGKSAATAAESASGLSRLAKSGTPIAVAIDGGIRAYKASEIENRAKNGEITQEEREKAHAKNVVGMAGGWAGMWAGAQAGAVVGGSVGLAAGGIGATVGVPAGMFIGGIAGYIAGERVAEEGAGLAVSQVHASGMTLSALIAQIWESIYETFDSAAALFGGRTQPRKR